MQPARAGGAQGAEAVRLAPALDAARFGFDGLNCYTAGDGPPLLLVHSINAAASAAEVKPLFDHHRTTRSVFAVELPGYGFSDRSDRAYTLRLMTDALHAVSAQIRTRCGRAPLDAMALSLGCEFLARAAVEQPAQWGRLALVSPTGFMGLKPRRGPAGSTRGMPWLYRALSNPLWSQALFNGLTKPAVVRFFLQKTWGSKAIDETMCAYSIATAAQPGARHAPLNFLAGNLFSADIHTVYEAITQPVWASHGVRGDFTDYRGLRIVSGRPNWQIDVFQTGALPYFEEPAAFNAKMDAFLRA
jgi:pimeloyl-ACP methyl ester carboxylesterase